MPYDDNLVLGALGTGGALDPSAGLLMPPGAMAAGQPMYNQPNPAPVYDPEPYQEPKMNAFEALGHLFSGAGAGLQGRGAAYQSAYESAKARRRRMHEERELRQYQIERQQWQDTEARNRFMARQDAARMAAEESRRRWEREHALDVYQATKPPVQSPIATDKPIYDPATGQWIAPPADMAPAAEPQLEYKDGQWFDLSSGVPIPVGERYTEPGELPPAPGTWTQGTIPSGHEASRTAEGEMVIRPVKGSKQWVDANQSVASAAAAVDNLNALIDKFDQYGTETYGPKAAEMRVLREQIIANVGVLQNKGVLQKEERREIEQALSDPTSAWTGATQLDATTMAGYKQLLELFKDKLSTMKSTYSGWQLDTPATDTRRPAGALEAQAGATLPEGWTVEIR